MKRKIVLSKKIVIVISLFLLLMGCGDNPHQNKVSDSNELIFLFPDKNSNVELKREDWNKYLPVGFGTILQPNDLIKSDGLGVILCPDFTVQPIPEEGRQPCSIEKGWLIYNDYKFDSGPRTPSTDIPYIIFPRKTAIFNSRPILRWHNTGASSYTVSIFSNGELLWENTGVISDHIQYPSSAPELLPGIEHLLVVIDNDTGLTSKDDPASGLGFEILDSEELTIISETHNMILDQTNLSNSERSYTLAMFFLNTEFDNKRRAWGEVLPLLEEISINQPAPIIYFYLGEVFSAISLPFEAIQSYNEAITLAEEIGDLETQAFSLLGLWKVSHDPEKLEVAYKIFEALGVDIATIDSN
jgi:hypothetical protein